MAISYTQNTAIPPHEDTLSLQKHMMYSGIALQSPLSISAFTYTQENQISVLVWLHKMIVDTIDQ